MTIKVLLADDHQIVRNGLRALLKDQPDIEVIAEAENGRSAVQLAKELSPDVVIIDVAMPELNGTEATRQIVAATPKIKVIALSMHADRRFVIGMLKAGAAGYLLKDSSFGELIQAVHVVMENRIFLSPQLADTALKDYIRLSPEHELPVTVLTQREQEVLQLIAEGKSTKQIATYLTISVKT